MRGEDLHGKMLNLSDYKGKIIVLHLWATWCGPCVAKMPHLKDLAKQLEDEPFAVVGLNFDEQRQAAMDLCTEIEIPWPSWSAESLGGSVGRWSVDGSPLLSLYVLDHHGVIRHRDVPVEKLDDVVQQLIREFKGEQASR